MMNLLFLCTGNSCRSIVAEALFNASAAPDWRAMSAGSQPTGRVHPGALALLERHGIPGTGLSSKSWDALPAVPDVLITVCDAAAAETCPVYLAPVLRAHWGLRDPAALPGAEAEAAFEEAYRLLQLRIAAFFALPLAELSSNPVAFQHELNRIGQLFN